MLITYIIRKTYRGICFKEGKYYLLMIKEHFANQYHSLTNAMNKHNIFYYFQNKTLF